jgi:hypothetical protein
MHVIERQPKERDMHSPTLNSLIGSAREREIRAVTRSRRFAARQDAAADRIVLRETRARDHAAVRRIAQLDSAKEPSSPSLVAEIDGEIVAAAPIDGGAPVADPFRPTADVIVLLERRARQLRRAA